MLLEQLKLGKFLLKIKRYCKVYKKVQLIQNFNKIVKFAIITTKRPTFIKNPVEFFGNKFTLTFKQFNPQTNIPQTAKISATMKKVNILGGSTL